MQEPKMQCRRSDCGTTFEKRLFRCPSCKTIGIERLYKYRSFAEQQKVLEVLRSRTVWFPTVHNLEDPDEFDFELTTDLIWVEGVGDVPINESSLAVAKKRMKDYGVFSLSETNNSLTMWKSYADDHRGICLEFSRSDSNAIGNFEFCSPVIYSQTKRRVDPLAMELRSTVLGVMTSKTERWKNEDEWRMINKTGDVLIPFPGDLTGVIFGHDTLKENREAVVSILGASVDYYETSPSVNGLDLQRVI